MTLALVNYADGCKKVNFSIILLTLISLDFEFLALFESRPFWLSGRISGQLGMDIYLMNMGFIYN